MIFAGDHVLWSAGNDSDRNTRKIDKFPCAHLHPGFPMQLYAMGRPWISDQGRLHLVPERTRTGEMPTHPPQRIASLPRAAV